MYKRRYTTSLSIDPQTGKRVFKIEKASTDDNYGALDGNHSSDSTENDGNVTRKDTRALKSTDSKPFWWKWMGW